MEALIITLLLGAWGFAGCGYAFTFFYVRSSSNHLWNGIKETRDELKADIEKTQAKVNRVVSNDLRHLEDRVSRLEQHE